MEHESFVPIPPARLVEALRTPGVIAAALPGWQPDEGDSAGGSGAGVLRGRLRLRVGGSTITYRGTVSVTGDGPGFTVVAEGTEVRGGGTVRATAELGVARTERPGPGSALTWRGSAHVDGRLSGYEGAVVESAVRRLLDRFATELAAHVEGADTQAGAVAEGEPQGARSAAGAAATADEAAESETGDDARDRAEGEDRPEREGEPEQEHEADHGGEDEDAEEDAEEDDVEESDVVDDLGEPGPPSELEEFELVEVEVEVPESAAALDDLVPPAEAAHARRTMIGRSAEEVDHAPPRGRYAPVPAPDSGTATATLRWAAPAAAALLASAVVVGRVLRRRR